MTALLDRPVIIPLALFGAFVWGGFAGAQKLPWEWPVTVSLVAGLGAVVSDFAVNHEDVAFDFALTFTLVAIGWSAWSISRRYAHEDHRGQSQGSADLRAEGRDSPDRGPRSRGCVQPDRAR